MSIYIDRKYLLLCSARLRNFKQRNEDVFNFSCPFCGDSATNHLKARGYITKSKNFDGYIFTCHNCNLSTNMSGFLKHLDNERYKEYIMETFMKPKQEPVKPTDLAPIPAPTMPRVADITLPNITQLPEDHYARAYISARRIPTIWWSEIFFTEDYKAFMDATFPNHGKQLPEKDPRIVLFFTDLAGHITNVTGRGFNADDKLRYITVKVSEQRKVFGFHRFDRSGKRRVYITEGQFDAMFLNNAIASGDSNLIGLAEWLYDTLGIKPILVYDNEPRNREIIKQMEKAAKKWDIVVWPHTVVSKDINEMVQNGWPIDSIRMMIIEQTYSGLQAELKLQAWKRC